MYQTVNNFFKKIIGVDTTEKNSFLDDYDLKEKVGSGAYSVVFKSVRKSDDKYVAIKIVNRTSIRLEERESLNRESLILKSIHHPTILPLQEIYEEEFETILVSEWLEEGDLLSYIRRTDHYKEAECMGWVKDLLVGMESLHSMGVFVRGLKPESVLMRGNRIVIADVVFTHHLINDDVKFCVASSYASPEVITPSKNIGLSSEAAGDVWALGVLLYILISGKHPFVDMATLGQSDPHTLHQSLVANILRGQVDFSSPIWLSSSFSLSARDMVASMLNIDPLRRPSMQALLADHAKWLDQAKDMSQNTKELTESLQHLKQWNLEKRFKYQEHGAHVAARYNIASSRHPPSSSTSSLSSASSSHSNDNETLSDWLKKAEFSLALAPGFLGSYAQIGALKAISEVVELSPGGNVFAICGTSAGALTGGFIAKGLSLEQMEKEMFSLTREDIWDPDLPSVAAPSLLQGKKMRSCISERLSGSEKTPVTFDDCLCPFSVSTWHLGNLQKHVVSEGCLSSAIAASASVPLLFAPVKMNGDEHTLVDGALGDPTGLGCCRAIPSSGRVLHIGFPGEVPGFRGVGCPSFLDPKLVPSSACIDMVSVVLEKSPNVNIFKMKEEGPKASLLANKSIKALLDRPMTPPVITEATKERCQSKLRVIRASPPVENEGGILNWFRKRALGILNGPYPPPTDDDERETMRDGDEVGERDADEEAPLKRQRTVS